MRGALQNINQKLRESVGLDDDKEAELLAKKAETEAAQQKVFAAAKTKGIDPKLVDEANQNYRKAHALYDLDTQVKKLFINTAPLSSLCCQKRDARAIHLISMRSSSPLIRRRMR